MSIKNDRWIRRMAADHGMIEPFEDRQIREGVISYGVSSYGYDMRVAREFRIFTNVLNSIVDPKRFDPKSFVEFEGDVCMVPPNSFALARSVEYFRIPRNVITVCLGKSTYARCFSGDTRVALADGTAPTLEELARRADDGELFWGYSLGPLGRVIVALLEAPRVIGRDALIEVRLDNGEVIRCTPDHEFVRRDGRLATADDLRPGDPLMPLYRTVQRGYEAVYQPLNGHLYPTHRLADEWNLRHGLYADEPGTHRHHMDGDRRNNAPWNIRRIDVRQHVRLHNEDLYGVGFDPADHGRAIGAVLAHLAEDDAWRARHSAAQRDRARRFWGDGRYEAARRLLAQRQRAQRAGWTPARRAQPSGARHRYSTDSAHLASRGVESTARLLECDRSVFRRFPDVVARARGRRSPLNHKVVAVRELPGNHDVYCLTVPEAGTFALESGIFVRNCGIITNVTPFEPEWEGFVTLEISNTTPLPARIYANEGIAQVLFFEGDEEPEVSYRDKAGKYQGQRGVTLPKL